MNALQFTGSPVTGEVPLTVTFTTPDIGALKYLWDFGDGSTGEGLTVEHTYEAGGPYNVKLTAEFDGYSVARILNAYVIASRSSSGFAADFDGYLFSGQPPMGPHPLAVVFSGVNSDADFTWDFGDGTTPLHLGQTGNPKASHIYAAPGLFTVTLYATILDPVTKLPVAKDLFTRKNYVNVS